MAAAINFDPSKVDDLHTQIEQIRAQINQDLLDVEDNNCSLFKKALLIKDKNTRKGRIQFLYKVGKSAKETDKFGRTPFHYAAFLGDKKSLKYLLAGSDGTHNLYDKQGWTPLHYAILSLAKDKAEFLKNLLDEKKGVTDINARGEDGLTALELSLYVNNIEATQILTEKRANISLVSAENAKQNITLLMIACATKNKKALKLLINAMKVSSGSADRKNLLDINQKDVKKRTALNYAAVQGFIPGIKMLINAKANIDCDHEHNDTPLFLALAKGYFDAAEIIIKESCKISPVKIQKNIILRRMILCRNETVVSRFCEDGFGEVTFFDERDNFGRLPIQIAIDEEWPLGIYYLLKDYAKFGKHENSPLLDPSSPRSINSRLLAYAFGFNLEILSKIHPELVEMDDPRRLIKHHSVNYLIKYGAVPFEIWTRLSNGQVKYVLDLAIEYGFQEMIENIISHHSREFMRGSHFVKALRLALDHNRFRTAKIIVEQIRKHGLCTDGNLLILLQDILKEHFLKTASNFLIKIHKNIIDKQLDEIEKEVRNKQNVPTSSETLMLIQFAINNNFLQAIPLLLMWLPPSKDRNFGVIPAQNVFEIASCHVDHEQVQMMGEEVIKKIRQNKVDLKQKVDEAECDNNAEIAMTDLVAKNVDQWKWTSLCFNHPANPMEIAAGCVVLNNTTATDVKKRNEDLGRLLAVMRNALKQYVKEGINADPKKSKNKAKTKLPNENDRSLVTFSKKISQYKTDIAEFLLGTIKFPQDVYSLMMQYFSVKDYSCNVDPTHINQYALSFDCDLVSAPFQSKFTNVCAFEFNPLWSAIYCLELKAQEKEKQEQQKLAEEEAARIARETLERETEAQLQSLLSDLGDQKAGIERKSANENNSAANNSATNDNSMDLTTGNIFVPSPVFLQAYQNSASSEPLRSLADTLGSEHRTASNPGASSIV